MSAAGGLARLAQWAQLPAAFLREARRSGLSLALRKAAAVAGHWRPYRYTEALTDAEAQTLRDGLTRTPTISVLMPVFNTPPAFLRAALDSVRAQSYPQWELCVADDASTRADTQAVLREWKDPRLRLTRLSRNAGIAAASNAALALATGEFVALLDHDDLLTRHALLEMARAIVDHDPDVLYSDEGLISAGGRAHTAHLKPDFSPDLLLAHNYITHLLVARRALVTAVGGFRDACNGAQDYDLALRLTERARRVAHVRQVLYHWRMAPHSTSRDAKAKPYALDAGLTAVSDALARRGIAGSVEPAGQPHFYRVRRQVTGQPLVSIIIPFRDRPDLLETCLDAIFAQTAYPAFEVLAVNNASRDPRTADLLATRTAREPRLRVLDAPGPFNYSRLNNLAADAARGAHLVLMNNDVQIRAPDWIEALLAHSQRPEVGAVGARLLYPDGRLQHAGIVIGIGGAAGHPFRRLDPRLPGYLNRPNATHNVSAVTAALLMVKTALYRAVDGLDETHLGTAYNDVDFCLRLRERGLFNVYTPDCEAVHAESSSRGFEDTPARRDRHAAELNWLRQRHPKIFAEGDPFYHPGLSHDSERVTIAPLPRGPSTVGVCDLGPMGSPQEADHFPRAPILTQP